MQALHLAPASAGSDALPAGPGGPSSSCPSSSSATGTSSGSALVAFAAFFARVFYLGWAGRRGGGGVAGAILFLFGGVGYLAPVLMFAAGAVIVVRPMLPALHPLKTGVACLTCRADARPRRRLARARPGPHAARRLPRPEYLSTTAGSWASRSSGPGQALLDSGLAHPVRLPAARRDLLLTGASIAGIVTATREAAASTTERVRRTAARRSAWRTSRCRRSSAGARGSRAGRARHARGGAGPRSTRAQTRGVRPP